jgi:hypothetical protein
MGKIVCLLLACAVPVLAQTRAVGAGTEPPALSDPPLAGVKGAFFAPSVADLEASAKWYIEKLGLAVAMRTKSGKTSVIVVSGNGLTVELLRHDDATDLGVALLAQASSKQDWLLRIWNRP